MFQKALGLIHPGNSDGIDAQVLTYFTVVLLLGKLRKVNCLAYKISFEVTGNLNNIKHNFCMAAKRDKNREYGL
jgi:hypothetical protein